MLPVIVASHFSKAVGYFAYVVHPFDEYLSGFDHERVLPFKLIDELGVDAGNFRQEVEDGGTRNHLYAFGALREKIDLDGITLRSADLNVESVATHVVEMSELLEHAVLDKTVVADSERRREGQPCSVEVGFLVKCLVVFFW